MERQERLIGDINYLVFLVLDGHNVAVNSNDQRLKSCTLTKSKKTKYTNEIERIVVPHAHPIGGDPIIP